VSAHEARPARARLEESTERINAAQVAVAAGVATLRDRLAEASDGDTARRVTAVVRRNPRATSHAHATATAPTNTRPVGHHRRRLAPPARARGVQRVRHYIRPALRYIW
jgi:hypothetical protein